MVDHHAENAFAQKATLRACADNIQGGEMFSTPKIAPATPMQAWKKLSHRQESPDTLPSLSLGRSSAEMTAAHGDSDMPPSTAMPTKCGPVSASAPFRISAGLENKEDLLPFSLSKYEKSFDTATSLRNSMGTSSFPGVCVSSGNSAMQPAGSSVFSHADRIYTNVEVADERSLQTFSLPSKPEPDTSNAGLCIIAGSSALPYTPAPGEVANDAYKLYSELFPATSDTANGKLCGSVSGILHPSPFVGLVSDKVSQSEACGSKNLLQASCARNKDSPRVGKKLKLSSNDGRATSKGFLPVKEEPVFEEAYGLHESSGCRDAFSAGLIESKLKDDLRSCKENVQRDVTVLNCPRVLGPMTASGVSSDCPVDVKPAVGSLKFATLSKDMPLHASSFGSQAGEPFRSIAPTFGAWESNVQGSPSVDTDWGKFLALSATPLNDTDTEFTLPFQQRFKGLQAFLKDCDEANQNDQLQGLRALPAASRNGYAVELETRAIRLSLEEGRELQRMRLLNVLGRASENSFEELGGTPHGPRLPVLGASSPFAHVP